MPGFYSPAWFHTCSKCSIRKMTRYFTSDLHLGSERVLYTSDRPFLNVDDMTDELIKNCNSVASEPDDLLYHIGDLYCFKKDGDFKGIDVPWSETRKKFTAMVLPLAGNHDENNTVKPIAYSMRMILGGRFNCVLCHYPSYHPKATQSLRPGDINVCGHVHAFWPSSDKRCFIDKLRKVININVGVDVWNYKPVSEVQLVNYITHLMATMISEKEKWG